MLMGVDWFCTKACRRARSSPSCTYPACGTTWIELGEGGFFVTIEKWVLLASVNMVGVWGNGEVDGNAWEERTKGRRVIAVRSLSFGLWWLICPVNLARRICMLRLVWARVCYCSVVMGRMIVSGSTPYRRVAVFLSFCPIRQRLSIWEVIRPNWLMARCTQNKGACW